MKSRCLLTALVFCLDRELPSLRNGESMVFRAPEQTWTSRWIFSPKMQGHLKVGSGRRFFTSDHRTDLTQFSPFRIQETISPAAFLAKRRPPASIQYRRVTSRFFAVSSIRNGRTWYNRCNRTNEYMNCVMINYPAAEDRQWDAVVTRISLALGK